jgi:hypothetical protein
MKIESANGKKGFLLNPYHKDGKWVFRVYDGKGGFVDYDLCHSDLFVAIEDADAFFYDDGNGNTILDHSPATLGKTGE